MYTTLPTLSEAVLAEPKDYQTLDDGALVELCLNGDQIAWASILERYGGLIYSIARKGGLSPEDVADVYQSVCLNMLEGLEGLRELSRFSSWVTTITVRNCRRVRQRQRREHCRTVDTDVELMKVPDGAPQLDEEIVLLEQEQLVRQAFSMMGEPCRRLLTYLFYEKEMWSYQEIAEELGLSTSTIGPKRGRCLQALLRNLRKLNF